MNYLKSSTNYVPPMRPVTPHGRKRSLPNSMDMLADQCEQQERYKEIDNHQSISVMNEGDLSDRSYGDEDAEYERIMRLQIRWEKIQPYKPSKEELQHFLSTQAREMYEILNKMWTNE